MPIWERSTNLCAGGEGAEARRVFGLRTSEVGYQQKNMENVLIFI